MTQERRDELRRWATLPNGCQIIVGPLSEELLELLDAANNYEEAKRLAIHHCKQKVAARDENARLRERLAAVADKARKWICPATNCDCRGCRLSHAILKLLKEEAPCPK